VEIKRKKQCLLMPANIFMNVKTAIKFSKQSKATVAFIAVTEQ
jgi:hypothetical protein